MDIQVTSSLIDHTVLLAYRAGKAIMEIYDSGFQVMHKSDASPVTLADLQSHQIILDGLRSFPVDLPVISEESSQPSFEARRQWEYYWLVDPLDGTKEFINRNGEFTVNIALMKRHAPILGVVFAPALGVAYFAAPGHGAFKQEWEGRLSPLQVRPAAPAKLVIVASRSHGGARTENFASQTEHEMVYVGSSLKFCLVAAGKADVYPRFGLTSEWDTAAGQCIVEAAGGRVTSLSLQTLAYNSGPSLLNPAFLAFGDKQKDWRRLLTT